MLVGKGEHTESVCSPANNVLGQLTCGVTLTCQLLERG